MNAKKYIIFLMLGGLSAIIGAYVVYYVKVMSMKPEIHYKPNGRFGALIVEKCDIINQTFAPTWWSGSAILQTVVPSLLRSRLGEMRFTREILNCPDGGTVSLDWFEDSASSEQASKASPIALMFPGLIGDSQSDYLRHVIPNVHKLGYRVAAFNNRGRGGMDLLTPRLYCAANYDDIELAISHVRERNPNSRIVASGFSMGGVVLTKYLAEKGNNAKVDAAMLLSANYDLVNGTKSMETGLWNRLIGRILSKALINVLLEHKEVLTRTDKPVQWDKLTSATSFRELDRYFTCPMWGYADPEDYFLDASNNRRLSQIRVPTLILNSADDFFSPYETLPLDGLNDWLVFVVTRRGGHLGFMDGFIPSIPFYGDKLIAQYHKTILDIPNVSLLVGSSE